MNYYVTDTRFYCISLFHMENTLEEKSRWGLWGNSLLFNPYLRIPCLCSTYLTMGR